MIFRFGASVMIALRGRLEVEFTWTDDVPIPPDFVACLSTCCICGNAKLSSAERSSRFSYSDSNVSYHGLTLLCEFFGQDAPLLQQLWGTLCGVLEESNDTLRFRDDGWEQDWFLAKFGAESPIGVRAWYAPPALFH